MTNKPEIKLLPEDQWKPCKKCQSPVPEFANMPEPLRLELEALAKESRISAMARLRETTGCKVEVAKAWAFHERGDYRNPPTTPCPHCGQPLRTPQAKQCRFCGADWH
jgi:hypothetical protein